VFLNAVHLVGHNLDLRLIFKRKIAYKEWSILGRMVLDTRVLPYFSLLVECLLFFETCFRKFIRPVARNCSW
jgi:hypothetical protein